MLEDLLHSFKSSKYAVKKASKLSEALHLLGKSDEAIALEHYVDQGFDSSFEFSNGTWKGHQCLLSRELPQDVYSGDIWLDMDEMMLMLYLETTVETETASAWISLHPVWCWQFRYFLKYGSFTFDNHYWTRPPSVLPLLDIGRASYEAMQNITNVFYEEALTYVAWYGKALCTVSCLSLAKYMLDDTKFEALCPSNLFFWGYRMPEYTPMEVSHGNFRTPMESDVHLVPSRTVDANVGFSTALQLRSSFYDIVPSQRIERNIGIYLQNSGRVKV